MIVIKIKNHIHNEKLVENAKGSHPKAYENFGEDMSKNKVIFL